jgi:hypothetical protein
MTNTTIGGISIPESKLAREVTELVRDTESPLRAEPLTANRYRHHNAGSATGHGMNGQYSV